MKIMTLSTAALLMCGTAALAQTDITSLLWGSPQEAAAWEVIVAGFEAENPDINVTVEVADWDSYWEKLRVQIAGGTPPDIFAMDAPLFMDWQSRDVLLNLQPYLDAEPTLLDGVYPITMEAYRTADGVYGLPRDFQTIVLYYNEDMFDAAGVAYPTDIWTYDDLRAAAAAMTLDKDGDGSTDQWGFWDGGYDMEPFWGALVWAYGGDVVDVANGQTLIGSPEATAAFQFLSDMWLTDGSMPTEQELAAYGWDGFLSGVAAMGVSGHWSVPEYSAVTFNWNIAPMPLGPAGRATSVNSAGFVIAKDSPNPDAAWAFVRYAFSDAGQTELAKIGLAIPVRESVANSPAYLDQATDIDHSIYVAALDYARMKPVFRGYEEWSAAVGDSLYLIWSGDYSVADALAEAVAAGDDALARNQ